MNESQGVAAGGTEAAGDAAPDDAAATRDLVGWALQPTLRSGSLTIAVARRVLATALGIDEGALGAWDEAAVWAALSRMRGLVAYCDHLASEATFDDLTGALRRGPGLAALSREIDRARRVGSEGIVVGFLDVDGLKQVNDAEGHAAGDEVLRAVVRAIRERIRSYDLVFRYGGDEFICVLVGVTGDQADRTFADIGQRVVMETGGHAVSLGLAAVEAGDTAETVIARADAALYTGRAATPP
jgi:diguanylate cyclase (GGDEF)-like protein